jgi:hypothetical protein
MAANFDRLRAAETLSVWRQARNALFGTALLVSGLAVQAGALELGHIHGLGFAARGERLLLATDSGIAAYKSGNWYQLPGPPLTVTAFTLTADALYLSARPVTETNRRGSLALQKSRNDGASWQSLGIATDMAFHVMAAGYDKNIIYVLNPKPNRTLALRGLYYTLNDGNIWHYAQARNAPQPLSLAVHPQRSGIVAVGAREGLFLSTDHGHSFTALDRRRQIYAICFDFDGDHLLYAGQHVTPALIRLDIHNGGRSPVHTPALGNDTIAYIAQNPLDRQQLAIATFNRDVYLSDDGGETWQKIAARGRVIAGGPGE